VIVVEAMVADCSTQPVQHMKMLFVWTLIVCMCMCM